MLILLYSLFFRAWVCSWVVDIVTDTSHHTCCFTKAYGRYAEGTGSVLQCAPEHVHATHGEWESLRTLRLRYFSESEIARLHHFPQHFFFPDNVTRQQRYRLLGNSLNVRVVAHLLHYLFTPPSAPSQACTSSASHA
eukprot:TRINITY_DN12058_c0_g1_i1.p1 TRINITY_DN12058_c0_g1~~TRINITY_DN12058_c0_g1_i1.p1  ORF type:complete len:137 (-),score=13.47 TRINITY_DN12058_c0_g1_i1:42-452(-)